MPRSDGDAVHLERPQRFNDRGRIVGVASRRAGVDDHHIRRDQFGNDCGADRLRIIPHRLNNLRFTTPLTHQPTQDQRVEFGNVSGLARGVNRNQFVAGWND